MKLEIAKTCDLAPWRFVFAGHKGVMKCLERRAGAIGAMPLDEIASVYAAGGRNALYELLAGEEASKQGFKGTFR